MSRASSVLLLGLALPAAAQTPLLRLELPAAERSALESSPSLRALEAEQSAARERAAGLRSPLWPRLSVDGAYKYLSEVPELSLLPGRSLAFGDNHNYTVGPSLGWTAWDKGARRQAWLAAGAAAQARSRELEAARRQLRLRTRMAYFSAQLALEQVRLWADSLKLAQSQHEDIERRRSAGAASRSDALSARQEVLLRARQFRQARVELAVALRELDVLTGRDSGDLSAPLAADMPGPLPRDVEPASALVVLDSPADSLSRLSLLAAPGPEESHPAVRAHQAAAESARRAAAGAKAGLWPKVTVSARTSLDYPNGPVRESFHQNALGVAASLPVFEAGRARREGEEQESRARASELRADSARRDLSGDRRKAQDRILGLRAQSVINREAVAGSAELARLVYDSYKAGRSTFIEVQTANLRELEARNQAAATDIQVLIQYAVLASLSEKE